VLYTKQNTVILKYATFTSSGIPLPLTRGGGRRRRRGGGLELFQEAVELFQVGSAPGVEGVDVGKSKNRTTLWGNGALLRLFHMVFC